MVQHGAARLGQRCVGGVSGGDGAGHRLASAPGTARGYRPADRMVPRGSRMVKLLSIENLFRSRARVKRATPLLALIGFSILFLIFFSPVWASGRLLAPGDGFLYHFPHYYAPITLWDPNLATGFPNMADPQTMMWYPPAALLSTIPGSSNMF